ncbi:hypothetical protein [Streptomyces sp. WMMC940]|uniref:hypothetical protein n=1 Tax=Streptomyces sp. WMMC940 TaxID=3015153 RepID=UPI0022B5E8F8|nr:hypothetical protein [Streptomyces sp. WMMC940]MCZ7457351.1 hypothetical protein [Streptomyces sp. WMMC940]
MGWWLDKGLEDIKKGWAHGELDDDGYHAPRGNQAENKQFEDALRAVEGSIGRAVTPGERRAQEKR